MNCMEKYCFLLTFRCGNGTNESLIEWKVLTDSEELDLSDIEVIRESCLKHFNEMCDSEEGAVILINSIRVRNDKNT